MEKTCMRLWQELEPLTRELLEMEIEDPENMRDEMKM